MEDFLVYCLRFSCEVTTPIHMPPFTGSMLRGRTQGEYSEAQTKVDPYNWALACLGGAIAGRYKIQRAGKRWDYFVLFPAPECIELRNFREIREATYAQGLDYLSVQTAAAHFSVLLAQKMRGRRRGNPYEPKLYVFPLVQERRGENWALYRKEPFEVK